LTTDQPHNEYSLRIVTKKSHTPHNEFSRYDPEIAANDILKSSLRFRNDRPTSHFQNFEWRYLSGGWYPIHFMFGSRVGF